MNNISVIASFELLLIIGLFLITCPAEGYVAGWTDWSDQGMAKSTGKRQNELTLTEQQLRKDGETLFIPDGMAELPSDYPIRPTNLESPKDSEEVQSNEASSTDGDSSPKGQKNNVNHGTTSTFDFAVSLIVPMQ